MFPVFTTFFQVIRISMKQIPFFSTYNLQQTACRYLKKCALESLLKTGHWWETPCKSILLFSIIDTLHSPNRGVIHLSACLPACLTLLKRWNILLCHDGLRKAIQSRSRLHKMCIPAFLKVGSAAPRGAAGRMSGVRDRLANCLESANFSRKKQPGRHEIANLAPLIYWKCKPPDPPEVE